MDAMVGSVDGDRIVRDRLTGPADEPIELGERMVESLLAKGAGQILAEIRDADGVDGLLKT
jgi:porphobilinogen deaminase